MWTTIHGNWDWVREKWQAIWILWGLLWKEGVFTNVGVVKGMDYGPKQLWKFENISVVGGSRVRSFFLFNFLGFNMWGVWWCSYFEIVSWVFHILELEIGFVNCHE
jgi:hypothetical protein